MTTTYKQLSAPLRAFLVAQASLLAALVSMASLPAYRALRIDAANHPEIDVSLTSSHWIDTLDAARLPASVPLLDSNGDLMITGSFGSDGGSLASDGAGTLTVGALNLTGIDGAPTSLGAYNIVGSVANVGEYHLDSISDGPIIDEDNNAYFASLRTGFITAYSVSGSLGGSITDDSAGGWIMPSGSWNATGDITANSLTGPSGANIIDNTFGGWSINSGAIQTGPDGSIAATIFYGNGAALTNVSAINLIGISGAALYDDGEGGLSSTGGVSVGTSLTVAEGLLVGNSAEFIGDASFDSHLFVATDGLVLISPNGTFYVVDISDSGVLSTSAY